MDKNKESGIPAQEAAGKPVAWRIVPEDTLFLLGATISDDEADAEKWRAAGCRVEPLGVLAERQTVKTAQELAGALAHGETAAAIARLRSYFNDDDSAEIVDYDAVEDCRLLLAEYERIVGRSPAVGGKKLHKSMWQQPEYDPELSLLGAVKEMAAPQDGPECPSQPENDIEVLMISNAALTSEVLYLRAQIEHIRTIMNKRDDFIVAKGLWSEYVSSLTAKEPK